MGFSIAERLDLLIAYLCFIVGVMSILSGLLLVGDDRFLNRRLLSFSLMTLGINLFADGFALIGYPHAEAVKLGALVCNASIGLVSFELIRRYKVTRRREILKRGGKP